MVYGILTCGDDLQRNCDKVCAEIQFLADKKGISKFDGFLSFFDTVEKGFEEKITHIITDFFPNTNEDFFIKSGFDKTAISIPQRTEETDEFNPFAVYKSLYLAIFCSRIEAEKHLFITGTIDFTKKTAEEVNDIEDKFKVVISKIRSNHYVVDKCEFIYISQKDKQFDNEIGLQTKRFAPNTSLSDIIYYLQNSTVVLEDDKHVYSRILNDELKKNKEQLEQIDFYFPGEKSSDLLFDNQFFKNINDIISKRSINEFCLNFYTIEYYASQQRMDGQKKIPAWINNYLLKNGEYDYAKINEINNKISIFVHNLEPQFGMLIDSILQNGAEKITLKHFEVDGKIFFADENYKKQSAIIIQYTDGSSWQCYSEFFNDNTDNKIYIVKLKERSKENEKNQIVKTIGNIQDIFCTNLYNTNISLTGFSPYILIGFPGTGKTETTKFFSIIENYDSNDSEAKKIFSSDDRINNRAFSDNEESQIFRSKFEWAYPSRKEAKERIYRLVEKEYGGKDLDFLRKSLKQLLKDMYSDEKISEKISKLCKDDIKEEDVLLNELKEYYYTDYREIEYNIRKNQVIDSIDLAWKLQKRVDLGAKEILEPAIRQKLYIRGYKIIFLINAQTPFEPKDFEEAKKILPNLTENSWDCVKDNLYEIKKIEKDDEDIQIINEISNHAFEVYFDEVYSEHPEIAAEGPRRNIYDLKEKAVGGFCKEENRNEKCPCLKSSCNNTCPYWIKNKGKFKDKLKSDIWNKRFRYYLDYCQYFVVRKENDIENTSNEVNRIVKSFEYEKHKESISRK